MEELKKNSCINCNQIFEHNFCPNCGLKRITAEDKKIANYLKELLTSMFFADGKVFSTFKTILSKPGELTRTYINGNRKKYLAPLQLFFFANLLYFLFPVLSTFNTSLSTQMKRLPYSSFVKVVVEDHLNENEISYEDYRAVFEKRSSQNAKLLLVLLVVFQALIFKLLFLRNEKYYLYDFVAASAYFNSIYIIFLLILLPGGIIFLGNFIDLELSFFNDFWLSISLALIIGGYLTLFLKRAFQIKIGDSIAKSILLVILLIPSFILFRFILFWTTFWIVA